MAEWGVFAVSRGIWGDEDFPPEPYTEREAWMWLISAAAFKSRRVFVGRTSAMIERGEFLYSLRFLERRWIWGKNRVSRFLKRLENRDMIVPTIRDGAKIYSIKNYNKFQIIGRQSKDASGTATDTCAGHERDTSGTKKKQFEQVEHEESTPSLRSGGAAKRKSGIPESFPFQADIQAAVKFWTEQGRTDLCATAVMEAAQFRDRCVGDGVTALDWSAKWRTWYRNTMRFNKQQRSSGRKESQHEQRARIIAEDHAAESQYRDPPANQGEDHRLGVVLPYRANDGR